MTFQALIHILSFEILVALFQDSTLKVIIGILMDFMIYLNK